MGDPVYVPYAEPAEVPVAVLVVSRAMYVVAQRGQRGQLLLGEEGRRQVQRPERGQLREQFL